MEGNYTSLTFKYSSMTVNLMTVYARNKDNPSFTVKIVQYVEILTWL